MPDILDKFTSHLKNVLAKSYSLAVEMGSPSINPEHLLLSMLHQKGSIGGELLHNANISAEEARRVLRLGDELALEQGAGTAGPGDGSGPKLSPDAKRAIEKAVLTANTNEHKYVGTEHLLSGLLQIDSPAIDSILTQQIGKTKI